MIWFADEVFFHLDGSLSYDWMPKNTRKVIKTNGSKLKDCVLGVIQPEDGISFFLQTEWIDALVFSAFLNELSKYYPDNNHFIILDNVAYHKCQGTEDYPLPENIELMFLPPYSPDFNPIERLWKFFKDEFINNSFFKTLSDLKDAVYDGLKIL
ncbi:MAG: IS630 family transposase, partial [Nanoarchaeota archaeon]